MNHGQLSRADCIVPAWPAPPAVHALMTTRAGGVSSGPRATLDLGGFHDEDDAVRENRRRLRALLPATPHWLHQVHGAAVITLTAESSHEPWPEADAAVTREANVVCAVRVADCLPVLLADHCGGAVGAVHAGWRGLAAGVIEAAVTALRALGAQHAIAWLGPAIGPAAFEVGKDVFDALARHDPEAEACFHPTAVHKWHADLYGLARLRLQRLGIPEVTGGGHDTFGDAQRFFSYRRDRDTGRMAALVWRGA